MATHLVASRHLLRLGGAILALAALALAGCSSSPTVASIVIGPATVQAAEVSGTYQLLQSENGYFYTLGPEGKATFEVRYDTPTQDKSGRMVYGTSFDGVWTLADPTHVRVTFTGKDGKKLNVVLETVTTQVGPALRQEDADVFEMRYSAGRDRPLFIRRTGTVVRP